MPHRKRHVLARRRTRAARARSSRRSPPPRDAWHDWSRTPWEERAAVFLRAAELLAGPWRATLNAATMLDQSKTAHQAEIDAACELIDFLRFNVEFMRADLRGAADLLAGRLEPDGVPAARGLRLRRHAVQLHGDRAATSRRSAALMGNTVVWKPASTAAVSAHYLMRLFQAAGLPPGVINLVYGSGAEIGDAALASPRPRRRPLHRLDAASSRAMWKTIGDNIAATATTPASSARRAARTSSSRTPPRTPRPSRRRSCAARFEYQGQKCSAASRLYIAVEPLAGAARAARRRRSARIRMGDVADFGNFMGAVIDARRSFKTQREAIERGARPARGRRSSSAAGRRRREGFFVEPTVIETQRPGLPADAGRALRPDRDRVRLPASNVAARRSSSSTDGAPYGAHRRRLRARPRRAIERGATSSCATPPATST